MCRTGSSVRKLSHRALTYDMELAFEPVWSSPNCSAHSPLPVQSDSGRLERLKLSPLHLSIILGCKTHFGGNRSHFLSLPPLKNQREPSLDEASVAGNLDWIEFRKCPCKGRRHWGGLKRDREIPEGEPMQPCLLTHAEPRRTFPGRKQTELKMGPLKKLYSTW